ncbi:MAG: hypothetical protein WC850_01725 [Candidatus Gracilibacteria bacterium]
MKKHRESLSSVDFTGSEIKPGMKFVLGEKNKIKKKEGLEKIVGDISIVGGKFVFKEGDIVIVTKNQTMKRNGSEEFTNEITFQVKRDGALLEEGGKAIDFVFNGNMLIHHLYPSGISNISKVLIDARDQSSGEISNILSK